MSSSAASPAGVSRDTSRGDYQEIKPVSSTFFEDLCLSRPGGLPIIEDLSPKDAIVFYYGGYQAESDKRRSSRSRSVDVQLVRVDGADGSEMWEEDPGTEAKPATPPIPSKPPQATYNIVPLGMITSATNSRDGNIFWLKKNGQAHVQIQYIQSFAPEDIEKLFDPSFAVRYSPELFKPDGTDQPINAVSIRAEKSSHNIFVRLPYLGCGPNPNSNRVPQDGIENVLKIPRHRGSNGSTGVTDYEMGVWQSWQILFDNTRLALIKSPNSPSPNCAPLFGHQPTFGPLHALALIIGNLFRHEVQQLEVLRTEVDKAISNIETKRSEYDSLEPDELTKDARSDYRGKIKDSNALLERYIFNTKEIIVMLRKQLSILRDLKTITTNQQDPRSRPAFCNPVPLPQFDGQSEQLRNALAVFEQLIVERGRVLAEMNTLLDVMKNRGSELRGELRMVRGQLHEGGEQNGLANNGPREGGAPRGLDTTPTPGETTMEAMKTTPTLQETTVEMRDIMAKQGQTVSCFAYITAIFLPLEFFAQYLSMIKVTTNREFWMIAGPITVAIMIILSYFMFLEDTKMKDGIAKPGQWIKKKWGARGEEGAGPSRPSTPTNSASPGGGTVSPNSAVTRTNGSSVTVGGGGSAESQAAESPRNPTQPRSWRTRFNQVIPGRRKTPPNATNPLPQQPGNDSLISVVIDQYDNTNTGSGGSANRPAAGSSGNLNQPTGGE